MRILVLLWVVSVVPVMAQIVPIKDDAPPPLPPIYLMLRGADGRAILPANYLHGMAEAEPEISAPDGSQPQGIVSLRVTVAKSGEVVQAVPMQGDDALCKAAVDGVMIGWRYRPLLVNGEPQEFQSSILLEFRNGVGRRAVTAGVAGMSMGAPASFPVPPGAVRVSGGVLAGLMLHSVAPIYPPIARAAHVQGMVILHAVISKTGEIESLQAISGPPMLVGAAKDAVQQWTYRPYLLNGEPVEVDTTVNVNFVMADPPKQDAPGLQ